MKICSVEGCGEKVNSRGYCQRHYGRWKKHKDPLGGRADDGAPLKFVESIIKGTEQNDCIIWPFAKSQGYGTICLNGKTAWVHRYICKETHGEPKENDQCCHTCGNGNLGCVNPNHLYWGTGKQNWEDRRKHGRVNASQGEKSGTSILKEEDIFKIRERRASGEILRTIAEDFNISQGHVSEIFNNKRWKHI